ncbi:nucleotide sugar dehydrogenase [Companilactobacillus metriopterae]|uniref:nucleotide sugar dehydrogenase n=1 Tax=Companilactobacillus metriopterae TaxID=1909267 RepID=UPI0013E900FC|nr:nucleotide sugar dehydrogenase [Companilactobacillus metriopterae]
MAHKIAIIGLGYVGLANALALSLKNEIIGFDIDQEKMNLLKNEVSTLKESRAVEIIKNNDNLTFTDQFVDTIDTDFMIISTPTNFDVATSAFDTQSIEDTIDNALELNYQGTFIIKSTVPVGFTEKLKKSKNIKNILMVPEFLTENHPVFDIFNTSRVIVGGEDKELSEEVAEMFIEISEKSPSKLVGFSEAESIKLFSNGYLAMRVAYFNEIDSFAMANGLDSEALIDGISLDPRIGEGYNNPSFGYGGYCLPKDTAQMRMEFKGIESPLVDSIVESNHDRKIFISQEIKSKNLQKVGFYRLIMKSGSDNFRSAAIIDILNQVSKDVETINIYEPMMTEKQMSLLPENIVMIDDLEKFKSDSELIVANRIDDHIKDIEDKIFTRDIFHVN